MTHDMDMARSRTVPPTPRSRRLGRELRRLREAAGLTGEQAAQALTNSQSWVAKVESGTIRIRPGAVLELLEAYGVPLDDPRGRELVALARDLRTLGWWQKLDLPARYRAFIGFEAEAAAELVYEPTLVHGLLQTEGYARAVIAAGGSDEQTTQARLSARLTRQKLLARRPPLRLHVILGEAALRCSVGDEEVMAEQISYLRDLAQKPNVRVWVLPLAAGAVFADARAFTVLLAPAGEPNLAYSELAGGHEVFIETAADVAALVEQHERLQRQAVPLAKFTP